MVCGTHGLVAHHGIPFLALGPAICRAPPELLGPTTPATGLFAERTRGILGEDLALLLSRQLYLDSPGIYPSQVFVPLGLLPP